MPERPRGRDNDYKHRQGRGGSDAQSQDVGRRCSCLGFRLGHRPESRAGGPGARGAGGGASGGVRNDGCGQLRRDRPDLQGAVRRGRGVLEGSAGPPSRPRAFGASGTAGHVRRSHRAELRLASPQASGRLRALRQPVVRTVPTADLGQGRRVLPPLTGSPRWASCTTRVSYGARKRPATTWTLPTRGGEGGSAWRTRPSASSVPPGS